MKSFNNPRDYNEKRRTPPSFSPSHEIEIAICPHPEARPEAPVGPRSSTSMKMTDSEFSRIPKKIAGTASSFSRADENENALPARRGSPVNLLREPGKQVHGRCAGTLVAPL